MYKKLENYVNILFSDVPHSRRAYEVRENILSSLNADYDNCVAEGCSENEAYAKAISTLGDTEKLLEEFESDIRELKAQIEHHRIRRAKFTSIAVAMYIIGAAILVASSITANDTVSILAVVVLLLIASIATGMIIYVNMSIPNDIRPYLIKSAQYDGADGEYEEAASYNTKKNHDEIFSAVVTAFWLLAVAVYLLLSFIFKAWHLTWIIWIIAPAVFQLIKLWFLTQR